MNEKLKAAVYGFAVGDALGVPFEFKERGSFDCLGMVGGGTWKQPAGTWSDDTSMILATCESIKHKGKLDLEDVMLNFAKWYYMGEFTPHGECFDIGRTTRNAIEKYMDCEQKYIFCGGTDERSNGNGSLMRILPIAFLPEFKVNDVRNLSRLTHGHEISQNCCVHYVWFMRKLIDDPDCNFRYNDLYFVDIVNRTMDEVKSTGYVVDSLEAALWCFGTSKSYVEAVLKAVNLGGDTDTIAALTGALAGLKWGLEAIPEKWIKQLANKELIDSCLF